MRICKKCNQKKKLSEFRLRNTGTYRRECAECERKYSRENDKSEYAKAWRKKNRKKYLASKKINAKKPEQLHRQRIRSKTYKLVKSGKIKKENCIICGTDAEIHHHNYNNPFDITWLCLKHHREIHVELNNKRRKVNP